MSLAKERNFRPPKRSDRTANERGIDANFRDFWMDATMGFGFRRAYAEFTVMELEPQVNANLRAAGFADAAPNEA